ncbi:MAG: hypothetical protein ACOY5C_02800 [Pseudomonadota bacterium]
MSKTATPKPATAAPQPTAAQIVDRWFQDQIHNSPVSRHTEAYNHVAQAVAELKKRLQAAS